MDNDKSKKKKRNKDGLPPILFALDVPRRWRPSRSRLAPRFFLFLIFLFMVGLVLAKKKTK